MFRLTREVRLAVSDRFNTVQVCLNGRPDRASGYVVDIKAIDQGVRRIAPPLLASTPITPATTRNLFDQLRTLWPDLDSVKIGLTPYTSLSIHTLEHPMVRFSQQYEFSAAHRLHNPELTDQANVELFGKCNNPHGHGHNYQLQVTLRGQLLPAAKMDEVVMNTVINRFDHRFLNIEVPEFKTVNPTVENIARTIYKLLCPPLAEAGAELAAVTVWETPKTWCEYAEET